MSDFHEFKEAEIAGWAEPETALSYADGFAKAAEQCVTPIVTAARLTAGDRALDVCCGQGIITAALANLGVQATGVDFSEAMIDLARERVQNASFQLGDATQLDFDDNHFDAVTIGFGLLHIPDAQKALSEARRVLKPGGRLVYSVWQGPEVSPAFRILFGSVQEFGSPDIVLPPGPALDTFADPSQAFPILAEAGFSDPELETCPSVWEIDKPDMPFTYFKDGTVRGAILLRSQPPENALAIQNAVADKVMAEFGVSGPWIVPIPAAIVTAVAH